MFPPDRHSHCIHYCKVAEETENGCSHRGFAAVAGYAEDLGEDNHRILGVDIAEEGDILGKHMVAAVADSHRREVALQGSPGQGSTTSL